MNVPIQILENLKCSICEDLLSCGPVLVNENGGDICGRCATDVVLVETVVTNKPYNELAEMCMFPCKYEAEGCYEKISFNSMKQHEAYCEFRTHVCPVVPSESCDWIGSRNKFLEHIQNSHQDMILEQSGEIELDVMTASLKSFLTTFFNVLFLVCVQICLLTETIYYSVRRIGDAQDYKLFKFEIHIRNEYGTLIKNGEVASPDCSGFQADPSLAVKIDTLTGALNGSKNMKFIIAIQEFVKCFQCNLIKAPDEIAIFDEISHISCCTDCAPITYSCKNASSGCLWKGTSNSTFHNEFCALSRWCGMCKKHIQEFNMLEHNRNENHFKHNIDHLFEKYWHMHKDEREDITVSVKDVAFLLIYYDKTKFCLQGRPDSANKTKCVLILRNPKTKLVSHFIMEEYYDIGFGQFLWRIDYQDETFQPFINDNCDEFDVGVDIYYNE